MTLSTSRKAARWAKQASFYGGAGGPLVTQYDPQDTNFTLKRYLQSHTTQRNAEKAILSATEVSPYDKLTLLNAVSGAQQVSSQSSGDPAISMSDLLPALAGAGLGYLGAAYAAPILGLTPVQKKYFGIGSAALGAVLNTFGR